MGETRLQRFIVGARRICYLGMLAGALLFSKDAIVQYFEGKTAFEESNQPLTLADLPVVTVCYDNFRMQCWEPLNGTKVKYEWRLNGREHRDEFNYSLDTDSPSNRTVSLKRICKETGLGNHLTRNRRQCDQFSFDVDKIQNSCTQPHISNLHVSSPNHLLLFCLSCKFRYLHKPKKPLLHGCEKTEKKRSVRACCS